MIREPSPLELVPALVKRRRDGLAQDMTRFEHTVVLLFAQFSASRVLPGDPAALAVSYARDVWDALEAER
jgi:hypothetical protein